MTKKEMVNNRIILREMTPDEIAEYEALAQEAPMPPTIEERIDAMESAVLEILGVSTND